MKGKKRKSIETPKHERHNHHYVTRSKRLCCFCSSLQGSSAAVEHGVHNQVHVTLVACKTKTKHTAWINRLIACAAHSAFPNDLLLNILLPMPAIFLYQIIRLVCRAWCHTITTPSFIRNHLQISSSTNNGLLVEHPIQPHVALYIEPRTNDIDHDFHVTKFAKPPFHSRIIGSYRGLVLLHDLTNFELFHVVNLVTKAIVSLPPFPGVTRKSWGGGIALSYASSVDRYKVVRVALDYDPPPVFVCTVGVDQYWRKINLQGIDMCIRVKRALRARPFTIRGIIYWIYLEYFYGFAMDVNTETVHQFPLFVGPYSALRGNYGLCPFGYCISLHTGLGFIKCYCVNTYTVMWELFEMTDVKSSEWTKIRDIDIKVLRIKFEKHFRRGSHPILTPLLYMRNGDLWFETTGVDDRTALFCCNLKTGKVVPVLVKRIDGQDIIPFLHGSSAAVEHGVHNQVHVTLVACKTKTKHTAWINRLIACAAHSAFPNDLLLNILLPMPAIFLYQIIRLVCRAWCHTITTPPFIRNHLQISSSTNNGLLVEHPIQPHVALYIEPRTNDIDHDFHVTKFAKPPFHSRIIGSYRGLVLLHDLTNFELFHVVNLVTKAIVSLPPFPGVTRESWGGGIALSYVSSVDRYKVVRVAYDYDPPPVFVCTVGVDQYWRKINLQGIDMCIRVKSALRARPFTIRGIIYWIYLEYFFGFAMDVNTETVHQFPLFVGPYSALRGNYGFGPFGYCISLHTGLGFVKCYCVNTYTVMWELFEMTDVKSSEWTKIGDFLRSKFEKHFHHGSHPLLTPLYMRNGDLWFETTGVDDRTALFCCNLRTGKVVPVLVKRIDEQDIISFLQKTPC